jgi:hypothetical protein
VKKTAQLLRTPRSARRFFWFLEFDAMKILPIASLLLLCASASAAEPRNFLFMGAGELQEHANLISRPDVEGAQVVYNWKLLEKAPGEYDFTAIETDLATTDRLGKKLFIQIQDRFFMHEHRNVPRYLLEDARYGGGLAPQRDNPGENQPEGSGWVAMQWKPEVRERFQALISALAKRFDGRVYGINLPETAADIDQKKDESGFDCDVYFEAEAENIRHTRRVFRKSQVVQYVNFWPCDWGDERGYFKRFFDMLETEKIGAGGPDIVPNRPAQMKNSYPFLNRYKDRLPLIAMAVQDATLTYTNPATRKKFTHAEFVAFARDYLGVDIIFWDVSSPWLEK